MTGVDLIVAAVDYAARGWPVLPLWWARDGVCACPEAAGCTSPAKHPLTAHGLQDASTAHDVIRAWWALWPNANVGLRTGIVFDVLDVDSDAAGRALAIAAQLAGEDTDTCWAHGPMSITAHGSHLLYQPTGAKNTTALIVPKIDWRGVNGYIVAPPSIHATGHVYHWHADCGPEITIPLAPVFIVAALFKLTAPAQPTERKVHVHPGSVRLGGDAAVAGIVARLASAVEGERNAVLNWCAHTLGTKVHRHELDEDIARRAADELHTVALSIGLGDAEARTTITSGWTAGIKGRVAS